MKLRPNTRKLYALLLSPALALPVTAQSVATPPARTADDESVVILSPFEVSAEAEVGYAAATTLAGNRLNTELRDIGNAVTVVTSQLLRDIGAVNNESLLQYTTGTEVGSIQGNFAGVGDGALLDETSRFLNPNQNTRVRGLASADNTRDYFVSNIPWDGFNVDRVDLQRGPNSILFGHGSPAGIVNTGTKQATFRNAGEIDLRFGSYGTTRGSLDYNRVLIRDELAVRVNLLREDEKFQQDPAFEKDERVHAALRYEPRFLKRAGARTIFRANIEHGDIESNRPRMLPPLDYITPWFMTGTYQGRFMLPLGEGTASSYRDPATGQVVNVRHGDPRTFQHLNRQTFNPFQLQDDNTGRPNHGQQRPGINGGPDQGRVNPYFQPMIGNFGQQFGGPLAFIDAGTGAVDQFRVQEISGVKGIGPDGAVDRGIGGIAFHRPGAVASFASVARQAGLPFGEHGVYRNINLTDPSIYDFYNNLIDGPNKREWQKFTVYNLELAQTFLNDKLGFQLVYNTEDYKNGQLSLLSGGRQGIYVDIMSVYSDGTPAGAGGIPYQDGTPNPHVGRPFLSDSGQGGNNSFSSDREAGRATAFFTHDFARGGNPTLLNRILGRHTITGLYAQERQTTDYRSWQRYAVLDQNYWNFLGIAQTARFTDNAFAVNPVIYLGPSLRDRTTAQGANIPRLTTPLAIQSGSVRIFDSTWNAPNVDPGAPWENTYYPADHGSRQSTQSENPANYRGWINREFTITDSEAAPGNRETLTTFAQKARSRITSRAVVWQGHLLDRAIVGTYGYREDTAKSWTAQRQSGSTPPPGFLDLSDFRLPQNPSNVLNAKSNSYSIVGHLNRLPYLSDWTEPLPFTVSLFYARSSNFQPAAQRVDAYGEPLAAPQGVTHERGILFETRDGRYSLRINRYQTELSNSSTDVLSNNQWFIGASQAWSANWVNRFEFNWTQDTNAGAVANPDPTNSQYNYAPGPGETLEDAQRREAAAIAAWRAYQASVDPRFYAAWGINLNNPAQGVNASSPAGFTVPADATSKGWEYEFNANPTRNWRITINAARQEATRRNIGGAALSEFIENYERALRTTAAGDLRIWWGGAGNETALYQWNSNIGSDWTALKLQEGTAVPELRKWRVNAITNYNFTEGFLNGFNVGGGVRWQDKVVIGYPPIDGAVPGTISFDLSRPYYGPSETNYDFWVGYGRRLTSRIDWRIQLNVRNAFQGNNLIPITVQPDGSPGGYRIGPRETWTISNTFSF
jgi:catechol 2,3-dioxygenase-like lactoylglutathione lyase family enzyme